MKKIPVIYEDNELIVCVKPQGVSSQADKSNDEDVLDYFKSYLYDRDELQKILLPYHKVRPLYQRNA